MLTYKAVLHECCISKRINKNKTAFLTLGKVNYQAGCIPVPGIHKRAVNKKRTFATGACNIWLQAEVLDLVYGESGASERPEGAGGADVHLPLVLRVLLLQVLPQAPRRPSSAQNSKFLSIYFQKSNKAGAFFKTINITIR
jgi:hypothetical protein